MPKNTHAPRVGGVAVEFADGGDLLIRKDPFSVAGEVAQFADVAAFYHAPGVKQSDPPIPIFMVADLGGSWVATATIEKTPAFKSSAPIYSRNGYTLPTAIREIDRVICNYRLRSLVAAIARKGEDLADLEARQVPPDLADESRGEILREWAPIVQNRRNQLRRAVRKAKTRPKVADRAAIF